MFLLCKHVRLTCGFNKLMMIMIQRDKVIAISTPPFTTPSAPLTTTV